jgi:hypothetical protein
MNGYSTVDSRYYQYYYDSSTESIDLSVLQT